MAPAIRAASYSGVRVYEIQCRGVPVMRRVADAFINATQILRAAGLPKPQRTKILERDVTGGVHEKVQGGYAGFQGTWIPLESARKLAAAHGVEQDLVELFDYKPQPGDAEPPAKEKRKRLALPKEEPKEKWSSSSFVSSSDGEGARPFVKQADRGFNSTFEWSGGDEQQHEGSLEEDAADSSEARRSTRMALRPPGTRLKRRPVYPGEDEEEGAYLSPKKRRTESPFSHAASPMGPSTVDVTKSVAAFTQPVRAPSFVRDKTPPHAGKRCEGCGVTSTPQWRRGPSGKRTLCNACGVKWSFGRLNTKGKSQDDYNSDDSDLMDNDMDLDIDGPDLVPESSPMRPVPLADKTTRDLEMQVKHLKRQLRESERGRKRLRKILEEAVTDDSEMDRNFRQVVNKCTIRAAVYTPPEYAPTAVDYMSGDDDSFSDEDEHEARVVTRFLRAVKQNRARMEYNISRMHLNKDWVANAPNEARAPDAIMV
ncbi:hypothetical protein SpCBS45565_g02383 [Spizellomyces sp. 'palustris']|nr:hypothetical protein SpCBS45565_g02383 [Spizellomyces sp. 'palustris']